MIRFVLSVVFMSTLHVAPARHHKPKPRMQGPVVASWYYDAGTTGCGFHARYGIATPIGVPCGGRVKLCHSGLCVTAIRDDSGPYVAGRMFDLDPVTRAALNCSDLCSVTYAVLP